MTRLTTPTATIPNSTKDSRAGYGAALWALIFAALHVAWAMGWYVGLDHESARQAFQRRWFLVYDLVAAGLCLVAFAVALALVQQWARRLPFSLLGILAWGGTGLLALRGGAGVGQDVYLATVGRNLPDAAALWDVWFCLGAILFGISAWQFWHAPRMPALAEAHSCNEHPSGQIPRCVHSRRIRECGRDHREVDDDSSFAHSNDPLTTDDALRRPRAALEAGRTASDTPKPK